MYTHTQIYVDFCYGWHQSTVMLLRAAWLHSNNVSLSVYRISQGRTAWHTGLQLWKANGERGESEQRLSFKTLKSCRRGKCSSISLLVSLVSQENITYTILWRWNLRRSIAVFYGQKLEYIGPCLISHVQKRPYIYINCVTHNCQHQAPSTTNFISKAERHLTVHTDTITLVQYIILLQSGYCIFTDAGYSLHKLMELIYRLKYVRTVLRSNTEKTKLLST